MQATYIIKSFTAVHLVIECVFTPKRKKERNSRAIQNVFFQERTLSNCSMYIIHWMQHWDCTVDNVWYIHTMATSGRCFISPIIGQVYLTERRSRASSHLKTIWSTWVIGETVQVLVRLEFLSASLLHGFRSPTKDPNMWSSKLCMLSLKPKEPNF